MLVHKGLQFFLPNSVHESGLVVSGAEQVGSGLCLSAKQGWEWQGAHTGIIIRKGQWPLCEVNEKPMAQEFGWKPFYLEKIHALEFFNGMWADGESEIKGFIDITKIFCGPSYTLPPTCFNTVAYWICHIL